MLANRVMYVKDSIYFINTRFKECQGFVEKVGEIRFNKVKQKQVNKFNNLLKREANITGVSTQFSTSQAGRFPPSRGQHFFPGKCCSPPISTPARECPFQAGNNPSTQVGS